MPSLWKKQKGSKISRLVVDLQTTSPKRREALIVENGVSTSMVDVFGKSKDKLHKLSLKKKHWSKKHNTSLTMEEYNYPLPRLPTLASKFVSQSILEVPISTISPIVKKTEEDILEHKYYDSDLNGGSNTSNNEYTSSNCENKGLYNAMHVYLLCILVSILGVGITLYYMMFTFRITVGTLFLVLLKLKLKYVDYSSFPLFKNYYDGVNLSSILKGTFIVVVSLYTKRTILGVSFGAFVLFLLEILKKVIMPKHGQDVPNVEQNEIQKEESGKENVDVIFNDEVDMYFEKDVQENGVLTNGTETEDGGNEANVKDGTTRCLKVKIIKQGDSDSELVKNGSDEEKIWNEIVSEIDSLDKSYSIWPRQNQPFDDGTPIGSGEQLGKTEMMSNIDECSNMFDQIDKAKKRRKFWKKLVPKHIRKSKKKNKHGKEAHESSVHCPDDSTTEMEDNEMDEKEETFSISSNDDNKDEEDECFNIVNNSYFGMKDDNKSYFGMKIKKDEIMKGMIVLVIPLVGLIGGRFLAFVLTIVGCVMYSMLKS